MTVDSGMPGRSCPIDYRYRPEALCADPVAAESETMYVIGGLYGNTVALATLDRRVDGDMASGAAPQLVFNGDFNWFNIDPDAFTTINHTVLGHDAIQGNVEHELAEPDEEAGCGCAYPDFVEQAMVERSNRIIQRLQQTARDFPDLSAALGRLPRYRCYHLAGQRILVLHGDPESLAGWGLAHESLTRPGHDEVVANWFRATDADVIACTHTCLPAVWQREVDGRRRLVINNGSAGMGNLRQDTRGLITRLATTPH
ncbi:metallophosphoesterase family protein, partial [Tamilnaduibacter salinus]